MSRWSSSHFIIVVSFSIKTRGKVSDKGFLIGVKTEDYRILVKRTQKLQNFTFLSMTRKKTDTEETKV